MKKILCICLSSTIQRSITFNTVQLEKVNRSEKYVEHASGKAINSARVLNQLEKGCALSLCPLGENNADHFLKLAQKDNLDISFVKIPGNTRICWTLLDKTAKTTTELVVGEPLEGIEKGGAAEIKLLKLLVELLPSVDGVLLAGSRPGIWSDDLYAAIAGMVKDQNKFFLADYIGDDLILTLKSVVPDVIKINDEEFTRTFGGGELKSAIIQKSRELGNMIVVTRGSDSTYGAKNGEFFECESEKIVPVNTTACGDSFNAGFIYEYLNSENFEAALKKGVWCAARNAEREAPGSVL